MRYLSVCSGIEAASVAWHPLGWEPVAFSEIDPFASAVLAARFPHVPNLGNMEAYREWSLPPFDVLVGGTPCQSFSVAGLRKGLDDPRGNLALVYLGILERFRPRWCVWENVPGVLSSSGGRDFGSFLGGLAQLGYGFAYRVLDAQFIRVESHPRAVPQRRRRVFVVGHSGGDWRSAAAVLLEPEGVRRDSAPRREAGESSPRSPRTGAEGRSLTGYVVTAGDQKLPERRDWIYVNDLGISAPLDQTGSNPDRAQGGTLIGPADAPSFSWPVEVADPISAHEQHTYTHEGTTFRLHNVVPDVVAFQSNLGSQGGDVFTNVSPPVRIGSGNGKGNPPAIAAVSTGRGYWNESEVGATVRAQESPNKADTLIAAPTMAVRRLTPRECERLQGFPDEWTAITYRGKPASDGPRYKSLGNSMAVNVMRWVGERLSLVAEREEDETYMAITEQSPALFTAGTVEWNTPQVVIDALLRGWGSIALDPCSNEASIVPASLRLMLPTPERAAQPATRGVRLEDGLAFDWDAVGPRLVYVNPPFGLKGDAGALPWLVKAAAAQVAEVVLLLPARTDTAAFHEHVFGRCDALCFWQGRLRFSGARDPAPFPSVFLYWGSSPEKFNAAFAPHGKVILQP
jgi:DNA (cytosine-5)-methyltransferase 1